jgi:hypothetical protein
VDLPSDFDERLSAIGVQWNKAEQAIKQAEQVNNQLNQASVLELRYAGRKLIEAHRHKLNDEHDLALEKLADAFYDCCRAQHDAIDAATSHMASELERIVKKVSPKTVATLYPRYGELHIALAKVRKKIQASRLNREDRSATYNTISDFDLASTIELFEALRYTKTIMLRQSGLDQSPVFWLFAGMVLPTLFFLLGPYWQKYNAKQSLSTERAPTIIQSVPADNATNKAMVPKEHQK